MGSVAHTVVARGRLRCFKLVPVARAVTFQTQGSIMKQARQGKPHSRSSAIVDSRR
jgi:hypothetical protein